MTAMTPGDHEYRNETLALPSLFVTSDVVSGLRFTQCLLTGPAVMVLIGGGTMSHCTFDGPTDGVFWPLQPDRETLIGAVGFQDCDFFNCRFLRVGLAVPQDRMDQVKQGFGLT